MNGTVPSKLIADHIRATIKKPSRLRIAWPCLRRGQPEKKADRDGHRERHREVLELAVSVVQRDADRRQQRRAEQQEQNPERADDDGESHGVDAAGLPGVVVQSGGGEIATAAYGDRFNRESGTR